MDYAEAIRLLHPDTTRDAIWEIEDKQEAIKKIEKACIVACEAMKELKLYKDSKLVLIPESVFSKQCEELDEYKSIGSIDELREMVEKQRKVKPEDGEYCPICHTFLKDEDDVPGFYCMNCGQAIDWSGEYEIN